MCRSSYEWVVDVKVSVSEMGREFWREKPVGFLTSNSYRCLQAIWGTFKSVVVTANGPDY